jgi:hypothetical protein
MDITALDILGLILLLQAKHALGDGPLQFAWMVREKGAYGSRGGILHAAIHGAGSLAVLAIFGVGAMLTALLALADLVLHYHIDFIKESTVRRKGWTSSDTHFWWAYAADQFAHHVTYIAMAAAVILWI